MFWIALLTSDQLALKNLVMINRSAADFSELGDPIEMVARFVVQQDWFLKQTHADGVLWMCPASGASISCGLTGKILTGSECSCVA